MVSNRPPLLPARRYHDLQGEGQPVADETIPAPSTQEWQLEMEKSRESAARLLETLAQKIGGARAVRSAASGVQRAAHYVQAHSVKDVASGIERTVRRRP